MLTLFEGWCMVMPQSACEKGSQFMTDHILQAYLDVERAMRHYNSVLDEYVASLHTQENADARKLERMMAGTRAMRDSSGIYLAYAKFVAYGMPESEDVVEEDLQA